MIYFIIMIVFSPFTAVIPAVYAVNLLFRKKLKIEKNYWNIGLFLLFIYSVFSSIVNKDLLSLLSSFVLFLYFALNVFSQNYFVKMSRINIVIKYIVYLSVIAAIGGVIEKIVFILIGMPQHRVFSFFGNPNMAGAWFGNIILMIFYLKCIDKGRKDYIIYNLSIVLVIVALLLTESTGAFIALVGSIFIYYILKEKKDIKGLIAISITVGLSSILFFIVQNKVANTTPIGELVTSFNSRYRIWIGAINMVLKKPITGWGMLGMMQHGSNFVYSDEPNLHNKIITFLIHPHNLWLTFLVTLGVIGLLIYLYIKFNLYKDMIKLYKRHNKMLPLIAAINTMVIIQGIVDCTLYAPQLGIIFVFIGTITYNMANNKMIRKVRFSKYKKKENDNKDIAI
ncbi:O-antigen ligase family protein [Clostridium sp. D43t1_170807_H7]|uniref:O-antigen ligase family protein n=1 Tax=Clostridium sp. D43t1_170807_H7 TaxID=2787140 RepID=UPI0018992AD9|nr:O-antigen ligase family protein [Clostridium sp. D43t1_170807_H7]MEE0932931.1 O-antigen ligase family protein [Clostridium sp.]